MEGALLVGGTPADKACTSTLCSTLRIKSWHLSMGQGPPRRGPVSVQRSVLPVSPAARVHFNSLNVPHSVSQNMCTPIQTYLTLKLRGHLQKAYEKPRVGLVPLRSAQEAPWPCRWNALCWNKTSVPHLPCVPGIQPRVGHTGSLVCLWNEHTRADASQQRARGWVSADLSLIPAPRTTTLNSPFTSAGFLLPLIQRRWHWVSSQLRIERKLRLSLGPQKHFEKNPFLLFMLIFSHLFTYVQIFPTFHVCLIFIQRNLCITNLPFHSAPFQLVSGKIN